MPPHRVRNHVALGPPTPVLAEKPHTTILKGGDKDASDPASYRGIYLISALAKLFEGVLVTRLTTYTEAHNILTDNQFGSRPDRQAHDAIYSLLSIIQYNRQYQKKPTYVAFIDYTTADPSVFREGLCHELYKQGIRGRMWRHLRERFNKISVRVLHPLILATSFVNVMRGLPEGSRLSPILSGIVAADLIRELQKELPRISIQCASHAQGGHPAEEG